MILANGWQIGHGIEIDHRWAIRVGLCDSPNFVELARGGAGRLSRLLFADHDSAEQAKARASPRKDNSRHGSLPCAASTVLATK
jgi:hypothetical protein